MQIAGFAGRQILSTALLVAGWIALTVCSGAQGTPAALPEVPLESENTAPPAFDPATNATSPTPATAVRPAVPSKPESFMPLEQARDEIRRALIAREYNRVIDLGAKIEQHYHTSGGSDYYVKLAQRRLESQANAGMDKRPYRRLSEMPTSLDLAAVKTPAVPVSSVTQAVEAKPAQTSVKLAPVVKPADEQAVPVAKETSTETPVAVATEVPDRVVAMATPAPTVAPAFPVNPSATENAAPRVLAPIKKTERPLGMIIALALGVLVVIAAVVLLISRRRGAPELEPAGRVTPASPGVDDSFAVAGGGPMIFDDEPSVSAVIEEPVQRTLEPDSTDSMFTIEPAPAHAETADDAVFKAPLERMFEESEDPFAKRAAAPAAEEPPRLKEEHYPSDHYESFITGDEPEPDTSSINLNDDTSTQQKEEPTSRHPSFEDSGLIQLDDLMLREEEPEEASIEATDLPMAHYDEPSIEAMDTEFNTEYAPSARTSDAGTAGGTHVEALPGAEFAFDPSLSGGEATETSISLPSIEDTADSTATSDLPGFQMPENQAFLPDETVEIALNQPQSGISHEETMGLEPETLPSVPMDSFGEQTQVSESSSFGTQSESMPSYFAPPSASPPPPPPPSAPATPTAAVTRPVAPSHADYTAPLSEDLFDRESRMGEADFANENWAGAVHHFSIAAALRPDEQAIKERLREARRMRKDSQGQ